MMYLKSLLLLFFIESVLAVAKFTKIQCITLDKSFADFDYCRLDTIKGGKAQISARTHLFQTPVDNISIHYQLMKNSNGYKPFLYDITFDACKFLKNRKNPVLNYLSAIITRNSNMNHTCPYDHDLIIEKLEMMPLPIPAGEYALWTTWTVYNVHRATVNFYFTT